jgi:dGTPase
MVSKIARTIGRALNLNEDLIEAIALGHDIGHVPFGHTGEAILNEISINANEGYFNHNVQSVRTLMTLENNGNGENLSIQVLDGILCHNGEFLEGEYHVKQKTKDEFLKEYEACYNNKEVLKSLHPMTLEGCVVRISDIIGYVGRDIEDAIRLGVLKKDELNPEIVNTLGSNNRDIINNLVLDIIYNSYGHDYICLSNKMYHLLKDLKKFNYEHIYNKAMTQEQRNNYKEMFEFLFNTFVKQIENNDSSEKIFTVFLLYKCESYLKNTTTARKAIDYIAGMTDDYFINEYNRLKNFK